MLKLSHKYRYMSSSIDFCASRFITIPRKKIFQPMDDWKWEISHQQGSADELPTQTSCTKKVKSQKKYSTFASSLIPPKNGARFNDPSVQMHGVFLFCRQDVVVNLPRVFKKNPSQPRGPYMMTPVPKLHAKSFPQIDPYIFGHQVWSPKELAGIYFRSLQHPGLYMCIYNGVL